MDTLTASPIRTPAHAHDAGFLPAEAPLAMEPGSLNQAPPPAPSPTRTDGVLAIRRAIILTGTAGLTLVGGYEMYDVVEVGGVTILEGMVLALFLILLAWIAFSFVCGLAGFVVTLGRGRDPIRIETQGPLPGISGRTAMLLPTYNEEPHAVIARLQAMVESVGATGYAECFDWYLLSDSTDPDIWIGEESAFIALRRACGGDRLYYRHRSDNTAKKSGNIAEWVRRFGAAYDYMIVLDADSLMSGDAIVRLVDAMDRDPRAALIQTLPTIVNAGSVFSRLQQFAGRLYGPLIAAGNAWWHGSEGNYWGHNAIIRVRAFAADAGLPELRGRKPFGGHILSHDFIEAALMRRAGWKISMTVNLKGSYEEVPPSLLDYAARDRRWCQGNLQHLAVLPSRGLHWVSRLHLLTGIGAYITAPLWLVFLVLGILISLQANFVRPEFFPKGFALFPTWPAQDSVLAARVFAATMGLLLVPKALAFIVLLSDRDQRRAFGGGLRVFGSMLAETLLAALIAPSMMIFQSAAVAEILLGRDAGWQVQRRNDGGVTRRDLVRKFAMPTLCGVAMAASAYAVSVPLLIWMSPVIAGLLLSIPIGIVTSASIKRSRLFATPEDYEAPDVLVRAKQIESAAPAAHAAALVQLHHDAELRRQHADALPPPPPRKPGDIDAALATAKAKLAEASCFEEAIGFLSRPETLAVLNSRATLEAMARMPYRKGANA